MSSPFAQTLLALDIAEFGFDVVMSWKKCEFCGLRKIRPETKWCPHCGYKVQQEETPEGRPEPVP